MRCLPRGASFQLATLKSPARNDLLPKCLGTASWKLAPRRTAAAVVAVLLLSNAAAGQDAFEDAPIQPAPAGESRTAPATPATGPSGARVIGSLAAVVVLVAGCGWVYRRYVAPAGPRRAGGVELLGQSNVTPKHSVLVLKIGRRVVVVGDAGHGMQPLCEVTDPAEVAEVAAACRGQSVESADLRGGAFAASFDEADAAFEQGDAPNVKPTSGEASDVRALINRVRGLSAQQP